MLALQVQPGTKYGCSNVYESNINEFPFQVIKRGRYRSMRGIA